MPAAAYAAIHASRARAAGVRGGLADDDGRTGLA